MDQKMKEPYLFKLTLDNIDQEHMLLNLRRRLSISMKKNEPVKASLLDIAYPSGAANSAPTGCSGVWRSARMSTYNYLKHLMTVYCAKKQKSVKRSMRLATGTMVLAAAIA